MSKKTSASREDRPLLADASTSALQSSMTYAVASAETMCASLIFLFCIGDVFMCQPLSTWLKAPK